MKGNTEVLECLNALLQGEYAARDQYFLHAGYYDDLGLKKLHAHSKHESEHENEHARAIRDRILMLGGTPAETPHAVNTGSDVVSMLKNDLALEYKVQADLKDAIQLCENKHDFVTRLMLVEQLKDTEEDHAYWLEQQLRLIELVGLPNYLQSQMGDDSESE